jgi:hypothetical protein
MSFIRLYMMGLPIVTLYSTFLGIDAGINRNKNKRDLAENPLDMYSNLIGYTSLGIITGITYPISFPLFGWYVLYKT